MYRSLEAGRVSMYAEFMGGGTYLRVRSFFFGDFLVFSVPFREQPGQPHHGRAHPGPLGGYRLLLEWVFFRLILILLSPLCFCIFDRGDVQQCEILLHLYAASATARSHKMICIGGRARVSRQPGFFFSTVCFLGSQSQGGESKARDPLLCSTKGEGGVYGGQSVSRFP